MWTTLKEKEKELMQMGKTEEAFMTALLSLHCQTLAFRDEMHLIMNIWLELKHLSSKCRGKRHKHMIRKVFRLLARCFQQILRHCL